MSRDNRRECPECGYIIDVAKESSKAIVCPGCKTGMSIEANFMASLVLGLVFGVVIYILSMAIYSFTGARPIYIILAILPLLLILSWAWSQPLRKLTARLKRTG